MARRPFSRFGARLLSIFLLAGCARDGASPVEPTAVVPSKPNALLLGLIPVRGVTRNQALTKDYTVSAVIDKKGGTLTIPEAGLTLVVPPGAVSMKTQFTAKALKGKLVAYEFEPHGVRFDVPLQFTQDLKKVTLLNALTAPLMDGAYFTDAGKLDQNAGRAFVSELLPATLELLKFRVSFPVKHFSGYLVSWH